MCPASDMCYRPASQTTLHLISCFKSSCSLNLHNVEVKLQNRPRLWVSRPAVPGLVSPPCLGPAPAGEVTWAACVTGHSTPKHTAHVTRRGTPNHARCACPGPRHPTQSPTHPPTCRAAPPLLALSLTPSLAPHFGARQ